MEVEMTDSCCCRCWAVCDVHHLVRHFKGAAYCYYSTAAKRIPGYLFVHLFPFRKTHRGEGTINSENTPGAKQKPNNTQGTNVRKKAS